MSPVGKNDNLKDIDLGIGDIVEAQVSIGKDFKSKKLLILIIQKSDEDNFIYLPLTSNLNSPSEYEVVIDAYDIKGIKIPKSTVVMKGVSSINKSSINKKRAKLNESVLKTVLKNFIKYHTANYYQNIHRPTQEAEFVDGKSKINYAGRVYDEKELINLIDSSLDFYLTAGKYDKEFCEKLSGFLSEKSLIRIKALTTNSGSSANLIAISALTSYKLGELALKEADEVITAAVGFPTTIAPIIQNRLAPVFVDIELGTYNIDPNLIERAVSEKTKAIFLAHNLGIPFDLDKILEVAERYNLWVIEDNCDAMGAEYTLLREYVLIKDKKVSGSRHTGTFGHIGTLSFYPAHHITTGEGGAVYTSDPDLYRILLSLRDWGRDCWCETGKDNTCGKRFGWKLGNLPEGYDHKYIYSHLGYNLKMTDLQAAIGVAQFDKLPIFLEARRRNWNMLYEGLKDLEEFFIFQRYPDNSRPSSFGFILTIRENSPFSRKDITEFLEENKIQTRTLFAGNILRQPALVEGRYNYRVAGDLVNTDIAMERTFWVGVYPRINKKMIEFMIEIIRRFVKRRV